MKDLVIKMPAYNNSHIQPLVTGSGLICTFSSCISLVPQTLFSRVALINSRL